MYAKFLDIQNMEDVFNQVQNPMFLNDLQAYTKEERRNLKELIVTTYRDADVMSSIPSCLCGKSRNGYQLGEIATCCNTEVSTVTTRKMQSDIWIRKPESAAPFITPIAWGRLLKYGHTSKFNAIEWFANPNKPNPPTTHQASMNLMNKLLALDIPRGYNNLVKHLDVVIDALEGNIPRWQRAEYRMFFERNRKKIFTRYVPIPSRITFIIEETAVGNYYDSAMNACMDAAMLAVDIETVRDQRKLEGHVATILTNLSSYYDMVIKEFISKKPGWLRQLRYGSRMDYTFRNIITCQFEPHDYHDIQVPYDLSVTILTPHLMNKLVNKHDMSYRQAYDYIEQHTKKKDKLLESLLFELIEDSPEHGLAIAITRYPSLARTSTQGFKVTGFTTDYTRYSSLATVGPNADFDGDILSGAFMVDLDSSERAKMLDGVYDIHSVTDPGKIKGNVKLPDTVVTQLFNAINNEEWEI